VAPHVDEAGAHGSLLPEGLIEHTIHSDGRVGTDRLERGDRGVGIAVGGDFERAASQAHGEGDNEREPSAHGGKEEGRSHVVPWSRPRSGFLVSG